MSKEVTEALEAMKTELTEHLNEKMTSLNEETKTQFKEELDNAISNSETIKEFGERFDKLSDGADELAKEHTKQIKELQERKYHNSDDRITLIGDSVYAGMDMLEARYLNIAHQLKRDGIAANYENALVKTGEGLNKDNIEAHFAMLTQRIGREDVILNALRDAALGRIEYPFEERYNATTSTGEAANFIDSVMEATLWADIILEPMVASRLRQVVMSTKTHELPSWDYAIYSQMRGVVDEAEEYPVADALSRKDEITAAELAVYFQLTQTAIEDSVPNLQTEVRNAAVMGANLMIDSAVINGDTNAVESIADPTPPGQNINNQGGTGASVVNLVNRQFDGLRKHALSSAARQVNGGGNAPTTDDIKDMRKILHDAGVAPEGHFFVTDAGQYMELMDIERFARYDQAAQLATVLSGRLERIGQAPVVVSSVFPNAVHATGAVSKGGANTSGSVLVVAPALVAFGMRVMPQVLTKAEINPVRMDITVRARCGVAFRGGLGNSNQSVAILRNVPA